jgi:hypothetical protein
MISFLMIGIVINLVVIAVQDFRTRKISIISMALLISLAVWFTLMFNPFVILLERVIINSILSCLILFSGTLMVKLNKKGVPFGNIIGSGDFLFLISTSPLFSFEFFLVFLNFSFLTTLILFRLYNLCMRKFQKTIPLAGGIAFSLCVYFGSLLFLNFDLFKNLVLIIEK